MPTLASGANSANPEAISSETNEANALTRSGVKVEPLRQGPTLPAPERVDTEDNPYDNIACTD